MANLLRKMVRLSMIVSVYSAIMLTGACSFTSEEEVEESDLTDPANNEENPADVNEQANSNTEYSEGEGEEDTLADEGDSSNVENSANMQNNANMAQNNANMQNAPALESNAIAPTNAGVPIGNAGMPMGNASMPMGNPAASAATNIPAPMAAIPAPATGNREVRFVQSDETPVYQSPSDSAQQVVKLHQGDAVVVEIQGDWAQITPSHFVKVAALSTKIVPRAFADQSWQEAGSAAPTGALPAAGEIAPMGNSATMPAPNTIPLGNGAAMPASNVAPMATNIANPARGTNANAFAPTETH